MKKKNTNKKIHNDPISIISTGKLGSNLALALQNSKYIIKSVHSRNKLQRDWLLKNLDPKIIITDNINKAVENSKYIFLTTTDSSLKKVSQKINWKNDQVAIHFSGALPLSILDHVKKNNAKTGTIHPLQTFPSKSNYKNLYNIPYAIESDDEEVFTWIINLINFFNGKAINISSNSRELYHAAAVYSCALLSGLIATAAEMLKSLNLERDEAVEVLLPLIKTTLEAISSTGIPKSITGPYIRGDVNTIKSHISALEQYNPKISLAYNALAFASMEIFNEEKILSDSVYNEINTNLIKSINKTLDYYKK